jgi:NAD(P)-dependent dehydrogenase (short-subunit alcohol dehydrogenase family)
MTRQADRLEPAPGRPLAGRSVLVFGPGLSLVRGIAHEARDRGASVAVATPKGSGNGGDAALPSFEAALGSESDADRLFDRAAALLPGLETVIVVVAAEPLAALHKLSTDGWRERVASPLRQVFWLARRAVEGFLADAVAGRLVLVVAPVYDSGETNDVVEEGLRSFARSFAREYGRRALACNLVLPAGAPTNPASCHQTDAPLIEHALFLASPGASFMNGEALVVRYAQVGRNA